VKISIDTMKGAVAAAAIEAGAHIVNDVSALRDPEMVRVCAKTSVGIVLMHMQGTPQTMQANPRYANVVSDTVAYLKDRIAKLGEAGITAERIAIDPGIGFGKTFSQTMQQLRGLNEYMSLGRPLCLGVSRKGFIGQITGRERSQRMAGTLAVNCFAVASGSAHILRVHDAAEHRDAVKMWEAVYHQG
jgi:dihydropteroate synthase